MLVALTWPNKFIEIVLKYCGEKLGKFLKLNDNAVRCMS